ncbi:MAG TPA: biotin/lipoyl-containing protein [Candidatus Didemnitutus sp.]|nr:biotin/lipoyl-containing protein [Candidatus Didemnitutus sp.]
MSQPTDIIVPREGVNDDRAKLVEWLVTDGAKVSAGQPVVVLETTKKVFELESPAAGYVHHHAATGTEVDIGASVGVVTVSADRPARPAANPRPPASAPSAAGDPVVSAKALELIRRHSLSLDQFRHLAVVREADVTAALASSSKPAPIHRFAGENLDPAADWDAILASKDYTQVEELLRALRRRLRAKYNRHVPLGTLLNDRWNVAKENGFGEGSNVYDECLILGDVRMGKKCWVGPFTILDGLNGTLTIGDYVDIGSGTHVYTHNTVERALTGHRAPLFGNSTSIGNCCFIAPHVTIAAGTRIGNHCFVAAGSYVEGSFPDYSFIQGNPAKLVGRVEVTGDRARIRHHDAEKPAAP